jgi:hypothetical protein
LKAIDACGGFSIVQTPTDCAAPDRPTAAHEAVFVNVVAPMNAIPASIIDVRAKARRGKAVRVVAMATSLREFQGKGDRLVSGATGKDRP